MRRFAGAVLASGFALAALVPLTAAAAAPAAPASRSRPAARAAGSAATPSPTPKPSGSPTGHPVPPPPRPTVRPGPPAPVTGMPEPARNCLSQRGRARLTSEPWAQRALGFSSVWDLTRGQHVTVAVVDSGIDFTPQLAGRVTRTDLTGGDGEDCIPHGTVVASIIAASDARARGIPFYGVAPAARILSIRVQQQEGTGGLTDAQRRKTLLNIANGIRYAVVKHARVINVSIQVSASYPALRSAVEFALRRNVVVVAAAGNDNPGGGQGPFYPASYPGVLSVNAADQSGQLGGFDVSRTPVSVTAPGVNVASDYPGGFDPSNNGTSFATAFVSGEAALVRSAYPRMPAAQVVHRIIATAAGRTGAHTGAGMINPVQAVTAVLPSRTATPRPAAPVRVPRPKPVSNFTRTVALSVTASAMAATALVAIAALVIPAGRRRHWHPGPLTPTPAAPAQAPAPAPSGKRAPGADPGADRTPRQDHPPPPTPAHPSEAGTTPDPIISQPPAKPAQPPLPLPAATPAPKTSQPPTEPAQPPLPLPAATPAPKTSQPPATPTQAAPPAPAMARPSPSQLPDVLPPTAYGQLPAEPDQPPAPTDPPRAAAPPPAPEPPLAPPPQSRGARHRRRK
jgi:membrane-anchored mycosin MYCP